MYRGAVPSNGNLNDYKTTGIYRIEGTSPSNAPEGVTWSVLEVMICSTTYIQRISTGSAIYTRSGNSSQWYGWHKASMSAV